MAVIRYHEGRFPPERLDWDRLVSHIGPANAAVARYDGILSAVPNAAVLLSPLTTQEAVLSSRIERTQTTMGEVLEFEAEEDQGKLPADKREDIHEILNYRRAMRNAEDMLKDLPLCQRIVKEAHRILLNGVRGHGKSPGETTEESPIGLGRLVALLKKRVLCPSLRRNCPTPWVYGKNIFTLQHRTALYSLP